MLDSDLSTIEELEEEIGEGIRMNTYLNYFNPFFLFKHKHLLSYILEYQDVEKVDDWEFDYFIKHRCFDFTSLDDSIEVFFNREESYFDQHPTTFLMTLPSVAFHPE